MVLVNYCAKVGARNSASISEMETVLISDLAAN